MRKSKYDNKFIIGDKFGMWTIMDNIIVLHPKNKEATILVECSCGKKEYIRCLTLIKQKSTCCFDCGHNKRGENHHLFTGYKEIPGSWFLRYKNRAKKMKFNINIECVYDIWIKQNKKCALSGLPIDFNNLNFRQPTQRKSASKFSKHHNYDLICTASLDRIDSTKGYTEDNIQLVHKDVNMMKKEYNQEYFLKICQLITKNNLGI